MSCHLGGRIVNRIFILPSYSRYLMKPASTIFPEKPPLKVREPLQSPNGDGLLHEMNIFWAVAKKFRLLFIPLFLAVAGSSFWYLEENACYTSTVRFTVPDWSQSFPSDGNAIYSQDRMNQTLMLFLSDSVLDFLIDKYRLLSKVSKPASPIMIQEVRSKVSGWISLKPSIFNSFILEVTTDDRQLSASVANDIFDRVLVMSKNSYLRDLTNRIAVLKRLLNTTADSDRAVTDHFERIQQQLDHLSHRNMPWQELQPLSAELNALQKQYDYRLQSLRINEIMLSEISGKDKSGVTIVQGAIPDFKSYVVTHLAYSLLITLLVCSLLPFAIHLFYKLQGKEMF